MDESEQQAAELLRANLNINVTLDSKLREVLPVYGNTFQVVIMDKKYEVIVEECK